MDSKLFVEKVQAKVAVAKEQNAEALSAATAEEAKAMLAKFTDKAKHDVKSEERDAALKLVLDTISSIASDDPDLVAAVAILRKGPKTARVAKEKTASEPRATKSSIVDTLFVDIGDQIHEDTIYQSYKLGRPDFGRLLRHQIKDAKDPSERKWISFDPETGIYRLVSIGANPPEGWTGYTPKAVLSTAEATDKAASADPVQGTAKEEGLF